MLHILDSESTLTCIWRPVLTFLSSMVPVSSTWLPTLKAAGIAPTNDAYGGNNVGGFFALNTINAANWTRSYSKSAYIDVLSLRDNLSIMAGATVERILFSDKMDNGNLIASTVQFSTGPGTKVQNVTVNKEVLMAGGAYGSAHVLQLSGVGPKDVLQDVGIPVQLELDGVGSHMTDHLSAGVFWNSKVDTQGTIHNSNSDFSVNLLFLNSNSSCLTLAPEINPLQRLCEQRNRLHQWFAPLQR